MLSSVLLSLLLVAGLTAPGEAWAQKRRVVELELIGPRAYRLDGVEYDAAGIAAKLAELDAETSVRKLVLFDPDGETSMADVIDFALLAKPIGARAFHKVDGELREISINIR